MMHLVPPGTWRSIAEVMTHAITREERPYAKDSWRDLSPERVFDALMRHIEAYHSGEKTDPDGGHQYRHMQHILTNAAILDYFERRDTDED